jgi:hypothetical protein
MRFSFSIRRRWEAVKAVERSEPSGQIVGAVERSFTGIATLWRYDRLVKYQERATPVVGAVLWQRKLDSAPVGTPIMPDGCLDLLWDGNRVFVAGPDTAVRWHRSPAGTTYVALRFSGGLGLTLLGVPADELRDRTANLEELWPGRQVRVLTEQVAVHPAAVLEAWVV